tara:strand:- start:213 stop:599 length:387 start_codon:yes stop_codon:yes gene_type:complete
MKRATLLVPSGPIADPSKRHLWIVVSNINSNQKVIWFPVCSVKQGRYHDPSCILTKGEHPFLTKASSWVDYNFGMEFSASEIKKKVKSGDYEFKGPIDVEVFDRVIAGMSKSTRVPMRLKNLLDAEKG